jgi:UDP-N-acetylmuramoyl-L-alanyl-D-glutamate--2,6-diaminopimelate ligase
MNLRDLLGEGPDGVEVSGLAFDNRAVAEGTLFFCVPGFTRDGHDFAPDAVARGAAALVVQRPLGLGVPEVVVADVRAAMATAAARFHGDPTARLRVVGITGTNGKTTSAFLVRETLEAAGIRTGLLGTVKSVVGGAERTVERTTPEAIDLQATFAEMLAAGDEACVMEVSSHALALHRASAIHFAVALFTNLTQDHLDFHPSMEEYFLAKRELFAMAPGVAIVNADDEYGQRLAGEFDCVTFAIDAEADYRATGVATSFVGSSFTAETPEGPVAMRTPMPGVFNVRNVLGAFVAAQAMGVAGDVAAEALARAGRVPGRFEAVDAGQPFAVIVDYSHTPDSLENALHAARELARGRVICVFGAGGDRDRGKRPVMGEIAARLADVAIVTSDNPRSEPPEAIIDEVVAGISGSFEREVDRRRAIERAVALAAEGDVVLIAGKGHELGQEFAGGRKEPFDDVQVARDALEAVAR